MASRHGDSAAPPNFPSLVRPDWKASKTLYDFDDRYTAPRNGFGSADVYYERCSLMNTLARIQVPGLIVHAMDDPFVSYEPLREAKRPHDLACGAVAAWWTSRLFEPSIPGKATGDGWTRVWLADALEGAYRGGMAVCQRTCVRRNIGG